MADRLPAVDVCRDARTSVQEGLKRLAQHLRKPGDEMATIVDAIVADVQHARARAQEMHDIGVETNDPKYLMVAAKYDEMILSADVRMLELGVKAAANEQAAIDRQSQINAYIELRTPLINKPAEVVKPTEVELEKLRQRQQLLEAATRTSKDAQFTEVKPFSDSSDG